MTCGASIDEYSQGFFQDFRQEGANVTIVELRGACIIVALFRVFVIEGML